MNYVNSLLNQSQISSSTNFDPSSFEDNFVEQMLSSVPSSFAWTDDQLEEQSKISSGAAKALMLQHQLLLAAGDQNGVGEAHSANDESVKALFNGFTGLIGQNQNQNQSQHFHHPQAQNFGTPGSAAAASGSGRGAVGGQGRQRVRARRGQATDPHSIAERLRRERIADRMKGLQELVPNANKTDKASMLDEIIDYVKFLQLQVKVLSMSRLGGASAVAPLVADEGRMGNGTQSVPSSNNTEGTTVAEHQVVKLMEQDMGSAMQYLQGKGLCLMPISLATAISTATNSRSRKPLLNGDPSSPSLSILTAQSGGTGGGEFNLRDLTSVSKP